MNFFAKIDSNNNVLEYPIPEGVLAHRHPDIMPIDFDPRNPPIYDEHSTLPEGYVFVKNVDIQYDWVEYEYKEDMPELRSDGFWYKVYTTTPRTPEDRKYILDYKAQEIREKRNKMLSDTDWLMMPDSPISDIMRQMWIEYRSALRNVPQQPEFPKIVNWPIAP